MQFLGQRLEGVAYRLVKEVGCICFTLNTGDESCFGASQGGPVQALEPGMQLDFSSSTVTKAVTGVQLQQPVHQVLALGRDVLILWPGQLPVQNTAEDFLGGVQCLCQLDKHAARKPLASSNAMTDVSYRQVMQAVLLSIHCKFQRCA